jgi:hypothetical protein
LSFTRLPRTYFSQHTPQPTFFSGLAFAAVQHAPSGQHAPVGQQSALTFVAAQQADGGSQQDSPAAQQSGVQHGEPGKQHSAPGKQQPSGFAFGVETAAGVAVAQQGPSGQQTAPGTQQPVDFTA